MGRRVRAAAVITVVSALNRKLGITPCGGAHGQDKAVAGEGGAEEEWE